MTDFVCPNCRGGFPSWEQMECPWCGQTIDGEYEPPTGPISTVSKDDSEDNSHWIGLFK